MTEGVKPPLGIKPREIHEEERCKELISAMARYFNAGILIPLAWTEELLELLERRVALSEDQV